MNDILFHEIESSMKIVDRILPIEAERSKEKITKTKIEQIE